MFSVLIRYGARERRYDILEHEPAGWEIRTEDGHTVVRQVKYDDWHRVERALAGFHREIASLLAAGWQIDASRH
jgi:hypothetical protein